MCSNPEERCERDTRQFYLKMAIDPDLLTSGVIEEFPCPKCLRKVRLELPPPRETSYPQNAQCPHCGGHLQRDRGALQWAVIEHPPTPYPLCRFCLAPANSREHVVPAWISKRLGINEFLSAEDAFVAPGGTRRSQDISFANYRARVMCADCNGHFKHLEDAVIPLLVPMAQGLTLSLDRGSQELLALWAKQDRPRAHRCRLRSRQTASGRPWSRRSSRASRRQHLGRLFRLARRSNHQHRPRRLGRATRKPRLSRSVRRNAGFCRRCHSRRRSCRPATCDDDRRCSRCTTAILAANKPPRQLAATNDGQPTPPRTLGVPPPAPERREQRAAVGRAACRRT